MIVARSLQGTGPRTTHQHVRSRVNSGHELTTFLPPSNSLLRAARIFSLARADSNSKHDLASADDHDVDAAATPAVRMSFNSTPLGPGSDACRPARLLLLRVTIQVLTYSSATTLCLYPMNLSFQIPASLTEPHISPARRSLQIIFPFPDTKFKLA